MLTPEQLEDYKKFKGTPVETLLAHIEEQARRIRELEADGERLDWLDHWAGSTRFLGDHAWRWVDHGTTANLHFGTFRGTTAYTGVRAAIDAARQEVPNA